MPRVGLSRQQVVEAAARLVDEEGADALSLTRLATQLGVRTPSLYNHIGGLDDLRRALGLRVADALAEVGRQAAMGKAGLDALIAVADAFREEVKAHPHTYAYGQVARPDDEEWSRRSWRAVEPILAILAGYGIEGEEAIHAARSLRAAIHGFVMLEIAGGFGLDVDVDESYRALVALLDAGLSRSGKPAV